jgi:hypothetical protein
MHSMTLLCCAARCSVNHNCSSTCYTVLLACSIHHALPNAVLLCTADVRVYMVSSDMKVTVTKSAKKVDADGNSSTLPVSNSLAYNSRIINIATIPAMRCLKVIRRAVSQTVLARWHCSRASTCCPLCESNADHVVGRFLPVLCTDGFT